MAEHGASIHALLGADAVDLAGLEARLDAMSGPERVRAVRDLGKPEQARLFDAAAGVRPVGLADFVPEGIPPLVEVIHAGRNSLPTFRIFEKRFCRPPEGDGELWGYNEHGARWMTGPGYFVARPQRDGEVLVDYGEVPPGKPEGWPRIEPNSAWRGRFVYGSMQDVLRSVSTHVSVGRATRRGKPLDNWFVCCRVEPTPA
jgi:hypothetical protein